MGGYTEAEVLFLLSLTERDVVDYGLLRSQLAQVTPDGDYAPAAPVELDPIPVYVRWSEIRRARVRVEQSKDRVDLAAQETLALELRVRGATESEIAATLTVSQPTAHRRWRALLQEVLDELGGAVELPDEHASMVPACLRCGQRPRARLAEVRRHRRGRPPLVISPEKQSSLCRECTPPERLPLLLPE